MNRLFSTVPQSTFPTEKSDNIMQKNQGTYLKKVEITGFTDDFYSNLLDWNLNTLLFATSNKLKTLNFLTSEETFIKSYNELITSVKTIGSDFIVGTIGGSLHCIDKNSHRPRKLIEHGSRIGVIERIDSNIFYTGSRDRTVRLNDKRSKYSKIIHKHDQEVCGLKYNKKKGLLATGGNDNKLYVLDIRSDKILMEQEHNAAVKALAWSPYNLLATGGGTADKKVKIWSLDSLDLKISKTFESQVCNLYWLKNNKIVSSHGYSQNDAKVLNNDLSVDKVFYGHGNRIINMAVSSDEKFFVTGSSDEYMMFWRLVEDDDILFR